MECSLLLPGGPPLDIEANHVAPLHQSLLGCAREALWEQVLQQYILFIQQLFLAVDVDSGVAFRGLEEGV